MSRHPGLGYFDEGADLAAAELYEAPRRPFGEATLLPPVAYRSKIFAELEDEKLWSRHWVCVGAERQIRNPGDLLPFTVGNHGVHVQRAADGTLAGRFNKAQHGGCRSIPAQCQTGRKTRCSYTSCGYSRDRDVVLAAELEEAHRVSNQYLGDVPERLLPVNAASLGPLLFVNLDRDPVPLAVQRLGFWQRFEPWLGSPLVDAGGRWLEFPCNWKLAGRAFMALGSQPVAAPRAACYAAGTASLDGLTEWGPAGALPQLAGLSRTDGAEAMLCWAYPNLLLGFMPDHVAITVVQPVAPDRSILRLRLLVAPAALQGTASEAVGTRLVAAWSSLIEMAMSPAIADQERAETSASDLGGGPGREANPYGYEFQQYLVEALLASHRYNDDAPLFTPMGR